MFNRDSSYILYYVIKNYKSIFKGHFSYRKLYKDFFKCFTQKTIQGFVKGHSSFRKRYKGLFCKFFIQKLYMDVLRRKIVYKKKEKKTIKGSLTGVGGGLHTEN